MFPITLVLSEQDCNVLKGLIDVTLKATGYQALADCYRLASMIEEAIAKAKAEAKEAENTRVC